MSDQPALVLCLMQCTNLGGMEQETYRLLEALADRGTLRFRIASPRPRGKGWPKVVAVDPEARDFEYRGRFGWRTLPEFRRHVREAAGDAAAIWIVGTCACCLLASRGLGRRRVLSHHYHHFENGRGGAKWRWFYRLLARDLAAVTYPTEFTRREAVQLAPWLAPRTHLVRYGYEPRRVADPERRTRQRAARRELGLPEEAFLVGNGGWLIPRKRFDVFLETAARVVPEVPRAHFVICGDGSERPKLEAQAQRAGLADRVTFTGWVADLSRYYAAWDVCLFNSDFDTLPCTPMEAAAEGCAVVASLSYGGLGEYLRDGVNGFFSREHDPAWLAARITAIARDPALAGRLIEAGWDILEREFGREAEIEAMRRLLLEPA